MTLSILLAIISMNKKCSLEQKLYVRCEMIIQRPQYLNALIQRKNNGRVKIITGLRRSGKSYLIFNLYKNYLLENGVAQDQIIELPLDEIDNIRYRNPFELNAYIKERASDASRRYYIFIDEIQFCAEVPNPYLDDPAEKVTFIDAVLGLMKHNNIDVYITGSNSKMLSREVVTQFRDRGDEIHVHPLSFAEFWSAFSVLPNAAPPSIADAWREYCTFGGMPYTLSLNSPEEKSRYLKNLFNETYLKDIIERKDIRNDKDVLEILLDFVSSAIGSLTNPAKLEKRFLSEKKIKVSHNTIAKYLDYFSEAYILDAVKRYDVKGAKYFSTPLKYYFADVGLRNARLNFRQIEEPHLMENIIYNDLIRRGFNVDVGVVSIATRVWDVRGIQKKNNVRLEVDFVANKGSRRYYIQAALSVADPEKHAQEIRSLRRIEDSFTKIVVVKDDIISHQDKNGILYLGIKDFLLNEHALI